MCIADVSPDIVGAGFDNWLDAVDGSFCTFEGGDDPDQVCINLHSLLYMLLTSRVQDGIYPDPQPGGYNRMSWSHNDTVAPTRITIHRSRVMWYHCAAKSRFRLVWPG